MQLTVNTTAFNALPVTEQGKSYTIKLLGIPNDQTSYRLLSFSLKITNSSTPTTVGALTMKNPVNYNSSTGCEATDESNSKVSWKSFASDTECMNSRNNPVITTSETVNVDYQTECTNNPAQKTVNVLVGATDADGDLTSFEIDKTLPVTNNARIEESLDTYIQRITSSIEASNGTKTYPTFEYQNIIKLDLQPSDIGKTIPIKVLAINKNNTQFRVSKTINVKVNEKVVNTNPNLTASITTPNLPVVLKDATSVKWSVSNSCDFIRYKVELWDKYCTTLKSKIVDETFLSQLPTSKSFETNWDTRSVSDGEYCFRVFVRNTINDAYQVGNSGIVTVQNNPIVNHSPSIISTPAITNIKVGEIFNYVIKTADQDLDAVSIVVNKKSDWLTLTGSTLSGTTKTTGKYDVSISAKDAKDALSVPQMFSITVSPSDNTPSVITYDAFPTGNTISGTYVFKWNVTDGNGIKTLVLNISSDGTTWTKLSDLKTTDKSYSLDTSKYKSGEYYLKLVVTDNKNDVVEKLSDKFIIQNSEVTGTITVASHEPAVSQKVTALRPEISVKLVLPTGKTLDETKFVVTIDEKVISTLCKYVAPDLKCTLDKDLAIGSHKVNVEYYDNTGVKGVETWEFEISSATEISNSSVSSQITSQVTSQTTEDPNTITIFGRSISKALGILLVILCIAGVLIFLVPLIIFKVWKKKDSGSDDDTPKPPSFGPAKVSPTVTNVGIDKVESKEKKFEPAFSYNTKKEFDINKTINSSTDVSTQPEVKKHSVVTNIPIVNTPTNTGELASQNSSFPNTNKYDNLPQSDTRLKNDPSASEPNSTWGLASRIKQSDGSGVQNNGGNGI